MKRIVVFGAGLVGGPMAVDLARGGEHAVTVVDVRAEALAALSAAHPELSTIAADLSVPGEARRLAADFDLVVSAVPGCLGFAVLREVIEAGRSVVDIAFFPEDPFALDELAKRRGVTAVVDCGVAPGMSNLLVGRVDSQLDETESAAIYVAGLPTVRRLPWEYKAVFSPRDVIEEYVRPARYVRDGQVVTAPALSDRELIDFDGVGTLEAFLTDGLRTLTHTISAPDMYEKTMRYPGHARLMEVLRDAGFFSREAIEVNGSPVTPLEVTSALLVPRWQFEAGESDFTVMRVLISGRCCGERLRYQYDLLDRGDAEGGVHSMARTTGFTATVVARMLSDGLWTAAGVFPPELIGRDESCVSYILAGLEARGVRYLETITQERSGKLAA